MSCPTVKTTCPYCGVGCGVLATRRGDGSVDIKGDPDHPANRGRLCSKGAALGETLSLDDRLLHPEIGGQRASWDMALGTVAKRFSQTIADHGPDSVAFYVSGQLLTEDYYVANKLMKGFIGSANIDTNSRLCMASSVAGHKRAFGSDTVPGTYEDLEQADLVVLVGSNLAWCHPVLYQRLAAAREARGTKVVVIDPRRTATCEIADLHLPIKPGSDVALFNGLLTNLAGANAVDKAFVCGLTSGFRAAFDIARSMSFSGIARATGLHRAQMHEFYDLFTATERVVTVYSQGVNQSTSGTDKVNAIINCHLATGRIGRPGMGPFSVTGQPNAMGGREVGGLANMLAAHMDLEIVAHRETVQAFWRAPRIASKPGLKAVDLFRAVGDGRVKALWIMATNPVDSMPQADAVRAAIKDCPFVVVSDVIRQTDTTALAHVLLPATAWGEKDGTVTNSERRISRQRAFLPAPGEARADWWQLSEVARRMGFSEAFTYARPADIFAEHAALSARDNNGARDFDIGAYAKISAPAYDRLDPFQWPQPSGAAGGTAAKDTRFFADGGFFTPDRRARIVATPFKALQPSAMPSEFPLVLNTGRVRDQWHTMTRTAKTPRLMAHIAEPFIEVHPADAARDGVTAAGLATVRSAHGTAVVRVQVSEWQQRGSVFVPMHWTDQLASSARIDALVQADVDPVSGQPGLKQTHVAVEPYAAKWFGFVVSRTRPNVTDAGYWALSPAKSGWRAELAGCTPVDDFTSLARDWLGLATNDGHEMLSYVDQATGSCRFAAFRGEMLVGAVFIAREPVAVSRSWATDQLGADLQARADRLRLLAGRPGTAVKDRGAIVCACFEVGLNDITEAITAGGCSTVDSIGQALKAGTNCGSCRSEIGRLIRKMNPGIPSKPEGAEREAAVAN
jgi:assimilatory nitrate reductase catalytic subunit